MVCQGEQSKEQAQDSSSNSLDRGFPGFWKLEAMGFFRFSFASLSISLSS